jgi:hypothetical protein
MPGLPTVNEGHTVAVHLGLADLNDSYVTSFLVLAAVAVAGAFFVLTCKPYQREEGAKIAPRFGPGG